MRRARRAWSSGSGAVVLACLAFAFVLLLTRDLFVMTEARGYAMYPQPGGLLRFFLLPELDWGSGRLLGQLQFQATWKLCGPDAACVSAVGALEVAVAVLVLVLHTRQLTGSSTLAAVTAGLWVMTPALIGVSLWQATRFDLMAFTLLLAANAIWWEVLGRPRLSRLASVATVVGSVLLLALAFNAKETTYALMVLLPVIAVLRGLGRPRGIRRNLALIAVPLAYGTFFIVWGLTHMNPDYAARSGRLSLVDGAVALVREGLGLGSGFMYLEQAGDAVTVFRRAAFLTYALLGVAIAVLAVIALVTRRRTASRLKDGAVSPMSTDAPPARPASPAARAADLVLSVRAELYLAAVAVTIMGILARSAAPAAYYLLIPSWAAIVLVLCVIRRLAAYTPRPALAATAVVAIWVVAQLFVLGSLTSPGSSLDQLRTASRRIQDIGGTLRTLVRDDRPSEVVWRSLGAAATDFYVLRDPAQPRPEDGPTFLVGQELMPYLVESRTWRPVVRNLTTGSVDEIRTDPSLGGDSLLVVVVDDQYRLQFARYEGGTVLGGGATTAEPIASPAQPTPQPAPSMTATATPSPPSDATPPPASVVPVVRAPVVRLQPDASPPSIRDPIEQVTSWTLPGQPMDIVADTDRTGWISLDHGEILRYELPEAPDGPLVIRTVASGLERARGIAIKDGVLYVVDLGAFPCAQELLLCEGSTLRPDDPSAGEREIISTMRASVIALDIAADGSLSDPRTILADLPVVDGLHAANGLELGPDGWLYLPVGGVDRLWWDDSQTESLTPHPEWIGTVLRFDGTSAVPEIHADGLRNVYEVTFDVEGRMWGVDNDGNAQDGYRFEEVVQIKPGHHYGYPLEGTFGPKSARDDGPLWLSQTNGTGGIAWAPDVGRPPGLLIGGCGTLTALTPVPGLMAGGWERGLVSDSQRTIADAIPGCITGSTAVGGRSLLAGVFGSADGGKLLQLRFAAPAAPTPTPSSGASFTPWAPPG